ncbi:MAG: preprotein translocase subunit SecE [Oscillospiraceae bacterium]|nr:preprotein translocase subunit SecE [Oscillospiraceae bacterium]
MADEKVTKTETAAKPAKKKKRKGNPIAKWLRELKSELKKVVWPTRKQIINNTIVVLVLVVVSAIVVWAFDQLAAQGIHALISIGG